jgi:hypothetical protein
MLNGGLKSTMLIADYAPSVDKVIVYYFKPGYAG